MWNAFGQRIGEKNSIDRLDGILLHILFAQWNDLAIRQTRWNARRSRGPMEGSGAPREPVLPPLQEDCEKTSNIRIVILWRSALVEGRLATAEGDAASKYLLHRTELPVAAKT